MPFKLTDQNQDKDFFYIFFQIARVARTTVAYRELLVKGDCKDFFIKSVNIKFCDTLTHVS